MGKSNSRPLSIGTFFCTFFAFVFFAFIFLDLSTSNAGFTRSLTPEGFMSILAILTASAMVAFSVSSEQFQFVSALFWVFQYVFFGITSYSYSVDTQPEYLATALSGPAKGTAYLIVLISGFLVASSQLLFYHRFNNSTRCGEDSDLINVSRLLRRTKILNIAYILLFIPLLRLLGQGSYLFRRGAVSLGYATTNLAVQGVAESLFLVIPVVVTSILVVLKFKYKIQISMYWLGINLLWVLVLSNPKAHPRQVVLFVLMPFIFFLVKKSRSVGFFLIYLIPIFLLYLANVINRYTGAISLNLKTPITSRLQDLDAFPQLANTVDKVALGSFPLFHQILGSIFFFLPRSLWPGKPFDTGVMLGQLSNLNFTNLSAPWTAEAFANARWFGVILVSISFGLLLAQIETRSSKFSGLLYASIASGSIFIVLRGSLLQATGRIVFAVFIILWVSNRSVKRRGDVRGIGMLNQT